MRTNIDTRFVILTILIAILLSATIFIRSRLNLIADSIEKNNKKQKHALKVAQNENSSQDKEEIRAKIEKLSSRVDALEYKATQFENSYTKWIEYLDNEWAKLCTGIMRKNTEIHFKLLQELGIRWENPPDEITRGVFASITSQKVKLAMNILSDFITREAEKIASKLALNQDQKETFDNAIKDFLADTEKQLMATEFTEVDLDERDFYADILNKFEEKLKPVLLPEQQTILSNHLKETWVRRLRK